MMVVLYKIKIIYNLSALTYSLPPSHLTGTTQWTLHFNGMEWASFLFNVFYDPVPVILHKDTNINTLL